MQFEIHLTVETDNIEKFKEDCRVLGHKPVVIETKRNAEHEIQVMTSDEYTADYYEPVLERTTNKFIRAGYKILRRKVEIFPHIHKHPDHVYYESHLRLTLPKDLDANKRRQLNNHCISDDWHFSKNILKVSPDIDYVMITLRRYKVSLEDFKKMVSKMEFILNIVLNLTCDKMEIEECIFDSNESIDRSWLRPLTATVFGGGKKSESPTIEYLETIEIGRLLAQNNYQVKTGGYGGLMEAASIGCTDEGGVAIGYTFKPYPSTGNKFLTLTHHCDSLYDRLRCLISDTDLFIVQKGGIGTLAELFLTLDICRKMKNPPRIILYGDHWFDIMLTIKPYCSNHEFGLFQVVTSVQELDIYFHDKQEIATN